MMKIEMLASVYVSFLYAYKLDETNLYGEFNL